MHRAGFGRKPGRNDRRYSQGSACGSADPGGLLRIVYLLESAAMWGGVQVVLRDANGLHARGHRVTVVCKTPPPDWMELHCDFRHAPSFDAHTVPEADVVVGTFWPTVPHAVTCGRGVPVHFCQGYEGDFAESAPYRAQIEAIYRLPIAKLVVSPHLRDLIESRFGLPATPVPAALDLDRFQAGAERPLHAPLRVGLIGPFGIPGKDIRSGLRACAVLRAAGLPVIAVRASNQARSDEEQSGSVPVEWHGRVAPAAMGDLYRSLDVFLGTCREPGEGFFLPAVEAMACGVPCVLADIPCVRAYGPGRYALFVPPGKPIAMARAVVELVGDATLRAELRQRGLSLTREMTLERHLAALERALQEFAQPAQLHQVAP